MGKKSLNNPETSKTNPSQKPQYTLYNSTIKDKNLLLKRVYKGRCNNRHGPIQVRHNIRRKRGPHKENATRQNIYLLCTCY